MFFCFCFCYRRRLCVCVCIYVCVFCSFSFVRLVAKEKEPITPFISKVRALFETMKVSSILVIGGCGDYFEVADTVIMMDCYAPKVHSRLFSSSSVAAYKSKSTT